jgi:hypothetical protein
MILSLQVLQIASTNYSSILRTITMAKYKHINSDDNKLIILPQLQSHLSKKRVLYIAVFRFNTADTRNCLSTLIQVRRA